MKFCHSKTRLCVNLAICLALAGGCREEYPRRYPFAGRVQFTDGQPVKTGTIEIGFHGTWTASGVIQRDGTFALTTISDGDGAVPGEYRAVIRQVILAYPVPPGGHDHGDLVHANYRDYRSTPLRVVVPQSPTTNALLTVEKHID